MPELRDPKEVSESLQPPPILGGDNTKSFSIREFVLASREKDIFQNWPFQVEYLNAFLDHGIRTVLPPFEPLTGRSEKTSEETVLSEICTTRSQIRSKSSERKCNDTNNNNNNKGNEDEKLCTPSQNHHHHHHHNNNLVWKRKKRKLMRESLKRVDDDDGDEEHKKCESELTDDDENDRDLKNCEGDAVIKVFTRRKVVLKFDFKGRNSVNSKTRFLDWKGSKGLRLE